MVLARRSRSNGVRVPNSVRSRRWSKVCTNAENDVRAFSYQAGMFEGSIIRVIRRLDELLLELVGACKASLFSQSKNFDPMGLQVIGNTELEEKFAKTETLIKRDIVFAASLYL